MQNNPNKNQVKTEPKLLQSPTPATLKKEEVGSLAWKITFGVILIILVGSFFIKPSYLPTLFDSIKSAFQASSQIKEAIEVTSETEGAINGQPYLLSIKHKYPKANAEGDYYLSYPCDDNISFTFKTENLQEIACDQPFLINDFAPGTLTIIPKIKNDFATTTIEISFVGNTSSTTDSEIAQIITSKTTFSVSKQIVSPNISTSDYKPTTETVTKDATTKKADMISTRTAGNKIEKLYTIGSQTLSDIRSENPTGSGNGDLSIKILKVGVIDETTNQFVETKLLNDVDRIALIFQISNKGGETVTSWTFSVKLPTNPPYTFSSEKQQQLMPGDYIEYTFGFDGIAETNGNVITIIADQNNAIKETLETNNTASVNIDGVNF